MKRSPRSFTTTRVTSRITISSKVVTMAVLTIKRTTINNIKTNPETITTTKTEETKTTKRSLKIREFINLNPLLLRVSLLAKMVKPLRARFSMSNHTRRPSRIEKPLSSRVELLTKVLTLISIS